MDYATIGATIFGAVSYSLTAWGKKEGQKFDWTKFGATVLIGVGTAIVMTVFKWDVGIAYNYIVGLGVVPLAENIIKIISRKATALFKK